MITQILQGILIPTFAIDNDHVITHWNSACELLTGLSADEMIGTKHQWRAFSKKEKPVMADLVVGRASRDVFIRHFGDSVRMSTAVAGAYHAEGFFPDLGEEGKWLYLTASPVTDEQGKIIGAIETLQDVTAGKRTEEAFLKVQEELERRVEERTADLTKKNDGLTKEIVNRRQVEDELQLSESKFRTVANFTYDWEYWISPEGHLNYISPSCERITGYDPEEFNNNSDLLISVAHLDEQTRLLQHFEQEVMSEEVYHLDFRIITRTGEERWISHFCQPVFDDDGKHLGRRASNRDITKRKRMEAILQRERETLEIRVKERTEQLSAAYDSLQGEVEERIAAYEILKESEEELRKRKEFIEIVLDKLPIGLAVNTISDGLIHYMNSKFTEIYGWPKEILRSFDALFEHVYPDPDYRTITKNRVIEDIASRDPAKMIWENLRPTTSSREQRVVNAINIPLFEQDLMISTVQDVTDKHKADEALLFTRFSIDHANDMIYWVDSGGRIVDVNETTCSKLRYSRDELLSMTVMDIDPGVTPDSFHEDWENITKHDVWRVESSHYCKDGGAIPLEIHINQIEFSGRRYNCVFARDITERRELERLVAIQDKMGSLGRVAAGIAHEIRNPLSTINVYLSTLKRLLQSAEFDSVNLTNIKESIEEMDRASHKIETVVKRVMDFSKPSPHKKQLMDVNQCVRNAVDLSAVTLRKSGVLLELKLNENLPECYMDSLLIEQVMLNLITNAIEELAESQGDKQLLVETAKRIQGEGETFIIISVADSGSGVAPELRDKIFDPFFTTKHYGSGIGLSICHRIISDHHGSLHVSTSKWGGALFAAEFPVKKEAGN